MVLVAIFIIPLFTIPVFAQEPEIFRNTEEGYKQCMERAPQIAREQFREWVLQGNSGIGYEGKFQKQEIDSCIYGHLYPLTDAGIELTNNGQYEEALSYFNKVLEIEPKLNDARMEKAVVLQLMGEHETAIALFKEVNEQNPSVDVSQYIEYSEQRLQGQEIDCGKGTIEKNGQCVPDTSKSSKGGGCLIATATYGSELAPQVQQLRELRDGTLLQTKSGSSFMIGFNQIYYSFSPAIADYERENPVFKETVKIVITPLITSLSILNFVDMKSESDVLSYGISLILLNVGMYFVTPIIIIYKIRSLFS